MPNAYGNDITTAGDYKVKKMILRSGIGEESIDIRALYENFEIFEDMFSPYMTAKIYMRDSLNLPEMLSIRGQEILDLEFVSDIPGIDSVKKTFRVYKIDSQKIDENGRGQQYTLYLMSEGGYYNYTERCGYSVKGKVSDMVFEIFKKHFPTRIWKDKLTIQPTIDNFSYVIPKSYSPFKAINWLSNRAIVGSDSDYSPCFFYETLDGYRFESFNKIVKSGNMKKPKYYYNKSNVNKNPETNEGSGLEVRENYFFPSIYSKIQNLTEVSRFDMIEKIGFGVISSSMCVHDLLNKEKRDYFFREGDEFRNVEKLGKYPHYISPADGENNEMFVKSNSSYFFIPFTPYTIYSKGNRIVDNSRIEEYFLKRKYIVNSIMTQKINIEIYGDSTKRVGQTVEVVVPNISANGHMKNDKTDRNISGDYLITAICHRFGKKYSCKMELSRNCMGV